MTPTRDAWESGGHHAGSDRLRSLSGMIEHSTRLFVLVGAVLYGSGVMVVSLHLSRFGLGSIDLIRTQYVSAGFWAWFPLFILLAALAFGFGAWSAVTSAARAARGRAQAIVLAALTTIAIIGFTWSLTQGMGAWLVRHVEEPLGGWASLLPILGSWVSFILLMFTLALYRLTVLRIPGPMLFSGLILFGFFHVATFAFDVYPSIPAALGGGAPVWVRFLSAESRIADSTRFEPAISKDFLLLAQSSGDYVVARKSNESNFFVVHRGAVRGYLVERSVMTLGGIVSSLEAAAANEDSLFGWK